MLEMPKNSLLELNEALGPLMSVVLELELQKNSLLELNEALGPLMSVVLELEVKLNLGEVAQVCAVLSVDL